MSTAHLTFLTGASAALALVAALALGLRWPRFSVWPAPPAGSMRSFAFWSLFRALNVAVLGLAALYLAKLNALTGFQVVALTLSAAAGVFYLSTLRALGRKATYCQASGLATAGVYRFTRNPQYASAIAAFACLAAGVAAIDVALLAGGLIAVYALMAHAEEPWLRQSYGAAYDAYASRTARFFGMAEVVASLRRASDPGWIKSVAAADRRQLE